MLAASRPPSKPPRRGETVDLLVSHPLPVWVPVVVSRDDGRACICYAPHDEDCTCTLPGGGC
jgi:hypothetical protein